MSKCRLFSLFLGIFFVLNFALSGRASVGAMQSSGLVSASLPGFIALLLSPQPNNPPVAVDDAYTLHGSLFVPGSGIIANDWDPDGQPLHLGTCTQPAHGSVNCTIYNSFTYIPHQGYAGTDSFTYQSCDSQNACTTGTVNLNVVNNAPVAVADAFIVYPYYGPLFMKDQNALAYNDHDPDGDSHGMQSYTQTQHGTLSYSPSTGTLVYNPRVDTAGLTASPISSAITWACVPAPQFTFWFSRGRRRPENFQTLPALPTLHAMVRSIHPQVVCPEPQEEPQGLTGHPLLIPLIWLRAARVTCPSLTSASITRLGQESFGVAVTLATRR